MFERPDVSTFRIVDTGQCLHYNEAMESKLHKELKERAVKYLWDKGYWIAKTEIECGCYGRYDVWGMTVHAETMGIEVKVSRSDWRNNKWKEYRIEQRKAGIKHFLGWGGAEQNYILCPAGLIKSEEVHRLWGLLWFNGNRLVNKKKAEFVKMTDKEKLQILVRFLTPKPF